MQLRNEESGVEQAEAGQSRHTERYLSNGRDGNRCDVVSVGPRTSWGEEAEVRFRLKI